MDEVEHLQPAGARHVLRHDQGIAGHISAEMAHHRPPQLVEPAARARADHDVERLASVEIGSRLSMRELRHEQRETDGEACGQRSVH